MSMFLCGSSSSSCVRNSPWGIPLALTSSLLSIRLWISGHEMSALIAAFRQLNAELPAPRCWGNDCWGRHFKLCVCGGNDRVSVSRRSVIHEDHFRLRIHFVLACAKLSRHAAFIPLTTAEENTSPLIGDIAMFTVEPSLLTALYRETL